MAMSNDEKEQRVNDNESTGDQSEKEGILHNHLIMQKIMYMLPNKDLLSCRLLNRAINQEACWQLNNVRDPKGLLCERLSLETILRTANSRTPGLPFLQYQSYHFDISHVRHSIYAPPPRKEFAQLLGAEIKRLSIGEGWSASNPKPEILGQISELLAATTNLARLELNLAANRLEELDIELTHLPAFPNLQEFHLTYFNDLDNPQDSLCKYIIRNAPRLRHINVTTRVERVREQGRVLQQIPKLLYEVSPVSPPPALSLSTFTFDLNSATTCLNELARKKYAGLRSLSLSCHPSNNDPISEILKGVNKLMDLNGNSTKELSINLAYKAQLHLTEADQPPILLPQMNQLTKLTLGVRYASKEGVSPSEILPITDGQFTKLQSLHVLHWSSWPVEMRVIPTLENLRIDDRIYCGGRGWTWHETFPNLKHLVVTAYPISFLKYLLTHLVTLEHFELGPLDRCERNKETKSVLWDWYTGGAPEIGTTGLLQVFALKHEGSQEPVDGTGREVGAPRRGASFANLKRLKSMKLFVQTITEYEAIAYMSAKGLMPRLNKLDLKLPVEREHEYYDPEVEEDYQPDSVRRLPDRSIVDENVEAALSACHEKIYYENIISYYHAT